MSNVTAVVLAAGRSMRMGEPKLLLDLGGWRMIDRVLEACAAYPTLVVASPAVRSALELCGEVSIIENTQPERGMSRSLALADEVAPQSHALLVFLADKPLVSASLAAAIVRKAVEVHADVCFPERDGTGGHPVYFSPAARERIGTLRGDALHRLRDDPALHRVAMPVADGGAYLDVDDRGALIRLTKSNVWKPR